VTNIDNVVTFHYSYNGGQTWALQGTRMEVSGIHHNVFGGFLSLRISLCAAGSESVRDFRYLALPV
jgi:xylan 1,4-beta-xylosidase